MGKKNTQAGIKIKTRDIILRTRAYCESHDLPTPQINDLIHLAVKQYIKRNYKYVEITCNNEYI